MKHVMNNTKNNMFKDKHLMRNMIALVFCIKKQHIKFNVLQIYEYTCTYIQTHMHMAMHPCVYT